MISDQHSIEYEFEDLQPEIGGVRLDLYISGAAVLAADPGYKFYVRSIMLDGTALEPFPKASRISRDRIATTATLKRPADDDQSMDAQLFRWIEAAIYSDEDAIDIWDAEVRDAAA